MYLIYLISHRIANFILLIPLQIALEIENLAWTTTEGYFRIKKDNSCSAVISNAGCCDKVDITEML